MSSVELLSRAGEVAIAKRIEAGRGVMLAGLCDSPLTFAALAIWRDALHEGKIYLRDIVDLEATPAEPEAKTMPAPAIGPDHVSIIGATESGRLPQMPAPAGARNTLDSRRPPGPIARKGTLVQIGGRTGRHSHTAVFLGIRELLRSGVDLENEFGPCFNGLFGRTRSFQDAINVALPPPIEETTSDPLGSRRCCIRKSQAGYGLQRVRSAEA